MRLQMSDGQISDFRQAMWIEPFHSLAADHMMVGGFLDFARNDREE